MPQLLPFYYLNQLSFSFLILFLITYIFSTIVLPQALLLQVQRSYIYNLSK